MSQPTLQACKTQKSLQYEQLSCTQKSFDLDVTYTSPSSLKPNPPNEVAPIRGCTKLSCKAWPHVNQTWASHSVSVYITCQLSMTFACVCDRWRSEASLEVSWLWSNTCDVTFWPRYVTPRHLGGKNRVRAETWTEITNWQISGGQKVTSIVNEISRTSVPKITVTTSTWILL